MKKLDVVWDMETNDPDDFLTLLLLAGHPLVNLKAVTIVPGSPQQVGFVRYALNSWFHLDIPVGAHKLDTKKPSVSEWHCEAYGDIKPSNNAESAAEVLIRCCDDNTTLIMGAPLTNLGAAIKLAANQRQDFKIKHLFVQGGFAGEGVIPPGLQLDKFKGLATCPTHNLIHDRKATEAVLAFTGIEKKYFVSKNVCHRAYYDQTMHNHFAAVKDKSLAFELIWKGMDVYLRKTPEGKLLHDPLTACCAIDETVGTWVEAELYRSGNEWGARLVSGSRTWIITDYNQEKFLQVLTAY